MGFFETLTEAGNRIISGSVDAKCWAYGVLSTGEVFYFVGNNESAELKIVLDTEEDEPVNVHDSSNVHWFGLFFANEQARIRYEQHAWELELLLGNRSDKTRVREIVDSSDSDSSASLWPSDENLENLFSDLIQMYTQSGERVEPKPMSEERYQQYLDAEIRSMLM